MRTIMLGCALALAGCGGDMGDEDAGRDAGSVEVDAGGDEDAGRDAGAMDAGRDAGDVDGGGDAGMSTFDAGRLGTCVASPIEVLPTCPAFTPCGGELSGTWCYSGVCIEEREFTAAAAPCPVTLEDFTGSVVGRVELLTGMQVHREMLTHVEGTIVVPSICLLGGLSCDDIRMTAEDSLGPDATVACMMSGGGCRCDVTLDTDIDQTDTYTTGATSLTTDTGGPMERTFDYCVDPGVSFRFRERPGNGAEPGTQNTAPAP